MKYKTPIKVVLMKFKNVLLRFLSDDILTYLEWDRSYKIVINYKKNNHNLLSKLCDKYGSDKGSVKMKGHVYDWPPHNYTDFYYFLFSHRRNSVYKVFECGIGTNNPMLASSMGIRGRPGASLRVWRDFFPNAAIIGGDIDKDILFEETRIQTFYLNQCDPLSISFFWSQVALSNFDFMLDDGLHTFEAGIMLFENSISKLAIEGIYVIEDVIHGELLKYQDYFNLKIPRGLPRGSCFSGFSC